MYRIGTCLPGNRIFPTGKGDGELSAYQRLSEGYAAMKKLDADFIEAPVFWLMELTESELDTLIADGVRIEVFNCFLPGDLLVCELPEALERHVAQAMRRMEMLGAEYVVYGSGRSRTMPEDMSSADRDAANIRFLRMCEPYAAAHGVTILIEPLRAMECNYLNTLAHGVKIIREAKLPHVCLLADDAHMFREEDNLATIDYLAEAAPYLRHVHFSNPEDRLRLREDNLGYVAAFAAKLREIGYTGRVSLEAIDRTLPDDLVESIKILRGLFA